MSCKRKESNSTKMAQKDNLKSASSKLPSGSASSKLPAGWIQKASRSHPDRIYYFNPETGQSVWNIGDITTTTHKNRPITRSTSKEDLKKKIDSHKIEKSAKSSKNHTNENKKTKDLKKVKSPITPKSSSSKAAKQNKSLESYIADVKAIQAKGKIEKINEGKRSLQSKDNISKTDSKLKSNTDKTLKSPSKRKSTERKKQDSITLHSICKRKDSKIKSSALPKPIVKDLVSNIINSSNVLVKTIPNKPERFKIPKKAANNSITSTIVPDKVINETLNNIKPLDSTKVDTEDVFVDDMEWEAEESCITENSLILPTDIEMFELDGYDSGNVADGLEQCIRVVDTNIYINDLDLVEQIVRKEILAVPWTVIHELDGLKTSNRGQVSLQARQASRWLSQQVKSKRPGIIFQRMSDVSTAAGAQESPDDKILLYCLYLKDLYGDNVSLVTDDTNLATKAQIEEVETYSSNALKEKLNAKPNIEKSRLESSAKLNTTKLPAISPLKNVEEKLNVSTTNAQDSKIKSRRKSDCEIDCDLVLTCLTHIWHIVTVISQSLCLLCGLEVPELINPRYPLEKEQAASVCQNVLQYVNQIGTEYEILISGVYTCENLQCLCNLLNNFKSNMMVFSHEAWKNTPIINQDQLDKFVQKERLKAEDGLKQLIAIRDQIIVCSTRL